ncbi:hypothetical protein D3C84_667230 [compost metagenome]
MIAHIGVTAMQATAYAQPNTLPMWGCKNRLANVKIPPADGACRVSATMHSAMTNIGKKYAIRIASGAW